ncbi:outer membrane lipid asymmetry maintenance protein MlaD [Marinomonas piezotolerans]|uniref:Outer membrane lipid asymmetry maintenance protein MlaD n=1 Tax=Marinomonas piezotolerans TaxID=2213058 RepID=A0A370UDC3_9GAMM|nr:outer membrane lipid asymmetry maintenance protein MlaD [Marinomonas piezotolerans]RDL45778.1 outer membrane lipid asymmetry maintenance protein MlaD [Marinomonas piezotolerans]
MKDKQAGLLVGFFMLMGLAAFVYLAIQVSGLAFTDRSNGYTLEARFDDVGGLTERAKITIAGVTVGEVSRIEYDKDYYMGKVVMNIYANVDNIPKDSSIAILTSGLIGEKYLGISIGADDEVLTDGDEIYDTQSALVLENLIGQFLFKSGE